ncbi:MAG: rRNA pseudouridine synthase [Clostridiales bacterium]|nr:rRNA pseudouridine synthase [Clostridiales bacterium]
MERLQKFMAECGVCSRRKAEEYIKEGKVTVNGVVVTEMGTKVGDGDVVRFLGRVINKEEKKVYILMNKPEGCVTAVTDDRGRNTVVDLVKGVSERIYPVGRLDYNTSGLLILTNDGDVANKLTHPKNKIDKVYEARIKRIPEPAEIFFFESGIFLDGRKTAPAKLEIISEEPPVVNVTIHEGRNRQVRRMLEEIDNKVISLKRVKIGGLSLGSLKKGKYREMTEEEVNYLKNL